MYMDMDFPSGDISKKKKNRRKKIRIRKILRHGAKVCLKKNFASGKGRSYPRGSVGWIADISVENPRRVFYYLKMEKGRTICANAQIVKKIA